MGIITVLSDLLFPARCVFCRRFLNEGESSVCRGCAKSLPYTGKNCERSGDGFTVCVAPLYYRHDARKAMLRFKFGAKSSYADCFGKLIADCVRENLTGRYDVITWVPLSRKRLRKRGYSQSGLLAEAVARHTGGTVQRLLDKTVEAAPQSSMKGYASRRNNIKGAFVVKDPEPVSGKRILLIDDIITTGATLSECAKVLRRAGAADVLCAVLCR